MANNPLLPHRHCVLLPVKDFDEAKERLVPLMDAAERRDLAIHLANGVVQAATPIPVAVVCDNEQVSTWADTLGAQVIWAPRKGLNVAVEHGIHVLAQQGFSWITVSHADLPFPNQLTSLPNFEGVTLVPDRHHDGTNVIKLPAGVHFKFSYGKGSFERHLAEAKAQGLEVSVVEHPQLSIDIDSPEDVSFVRAQTRQWGPEGPH